LIIPQEKITRFVEPPDQSWFSLGGKNMKRILFVGLIALLVLLAVPAAMAADNDYLTVSGGITKSIDVSTSGAPDFGTMGAGNNGPVSGYLTTTLNGPVNTFTVVATGGDGGYMKGTGTSMWLTNPIEISSTYIGYPGFVVLTIPRTVISGGSAAINDYIYFQQNIVTADPADTYKITVTFTGTVTS
jgi:hypothetical protein